MGQIGPPVLTAAPAGRGGVRGTTPRYPAAADVAAVEEGAEDGAHAARARRAAARAAPRAAAVVAAAIDASAGSRAAARSSGTPAGRGGTGELQDGQGKEVGPSKAEEGARTRAAFAPAPAARARLEWRREARRARRREGHAGVGREGEEGRKLRAASHGGSSGGS
jgi:hypothetical protein